MEYFVAGQGTPMAEAGEPIAPAQPLPSLDASATAAWIAAALAGAHPIPAPIAVEAACCRKAAQQGAEAAAA
jgi:anthranilate phosphoribosyltransferase